MQTGFRPRKGLVSPSPASLTPSPSLSLLSPHHPPPFLREKMESKLLTCFPSLAISVWFLALHSFNTTVHFFPKNVLNVLAQESRTLKSLSWPVHVKLMHPLGKTCQVYSFVCFPLVAAIRDDVYVWMLHWNRSSIIYDRILSCSYTCIWGYLPRR